MGALLITCLVVAGVALYMTAAGFVAALLRSNYTALQNAGIISKFADGEAGAVAGGVFWPVVGLMLVIYHRLHYGITAADRSLARASSINELRTQLAEHREREIQRMERDLGLRDKP